MQAYISRCFHILANLYFKTMPNIRMQKKIIYLNTVMHTASNHSIPGTYTYLQRKGNNVALQEEFSYPGLFYVPFFCPVNVVKPKYSELILMFEPFGIKKQICNGILRYLLQLSLLGKEYLTTMFKLTQKKITILKVPCKAVLKICDALAQLN